jgi:deoxyguanosine kinase
VFKEAEMTLISIEGNIGAGKSTLIELLKTKFPSVVFVDEPVDVWGTVKDSRGVTILEKYYENQTRYAFAFQMMAFITRVSRLRTALESNPHSIIVTERSVFTDREIFAKMLHDAGKIEVRKARLAAKVPPDSLSLLHRKSSTPSISSGSTSWWAP